LVELLVPEDVELCVPLFVEDWVPEFVELWVPLFVEEVVLDDVVDPLPFVIVVEV
jgi:hypothetical protein